MCKGGEMMLLSVFLIMSLGTVCNKLFKLIRLPGLLGMIVLGIAIGPYGLDIIDDSVLNISSDIRMMALVVILLRAGLGINKDVLKRVGTVSIKMSFIPCIAEGLSVMAISKYLLDISYIEAGMLGFIVAAVSPAVIVPFMIELKEKKLGMERGVPIIILTGAAIEDIVAITIFSAFLGIYLGDGLGIFSLLGIPVKIVGGLFIGLLIGHIIFKLYESKRFFKQNNEKLLLTLLAGLFLILIERVIDISGLLGVMSMGFYLLEKLKDKVKHLEKGLGDIWFFAQIFLFVLIGAEVNISVAMDMGIKSIVIIAFGMLMKGVGVLASLHGSELELKEKLFCVASYIPKATVQAAIGAIPLAKGVESGEIILTISVLAILLTAPLGAIVMDLSAEKLLKN